MGIKNLMKLLAKEAPDCYKETEPKSYLGHKIAIDASMQLYQFMVMVRSGGGTGGVASQLTNEHGEVTSHIQGFLFRTISLMEKGIKPVFVFDGKPPEFKSGELEKRRAMKAKAEAEKAAAEKRLQEGEGDAAENIEQINRMAKRNVKVTKEHNEDVKALLRLMGLPVVEAPCEAEAQCAELAKHGKVFATATEDMDALTFQTPVLLRRLTYAEIKKMPVYEISYAKMMSGLGLTREQFVDLCILCGCDYAGSIRGVGPSNALKLIKEHKTLEKVVAAVESRAKAEKYPIPPEFKSERLDQIRALFNAPEVTPAASVDLKFGNPDVAGLRNFLVNEKSFNADRVEKAIERLQKSKKVGSQRRMDSFFKVMAKPGGFTKLGKRKDTKKGKNGKKKKPRGVSRR